MSWERRVQLWKVIVGNFWKQENLLAVRLPTGEGRVIKEEVIYLPKEVG